LTAELPHFYLFNAVFMRFFHFCTVTCIVTCIVACTFFAAPTTHAQVLVLSRDTTVFRGSSFEYPLRATITESLVRQFPTLDSVRLVVRFTPDVLTLNVARGGGDAVFQCLAARVDSSFQSKSLGTLVISCSQLRRSLSTTSTMSTATITFCTLNFGTLVGRDSVARVSVDSLFINGQSVAVSGSQAGRIIVRDSISIREDFIELLDQNAPNPCDGFTAFKYTVRDPTDIAFSVFTIDGKNVLELPVVRRTRGIYEVQLQFDPSWATGAYYLRMKTSSGAYLRRFMIFR
jgi:hypothetical protein